MVGASFGEPCAEGSEVVGFEGHGGDGVAGVGVEAGGDENQVGLKGDNGVERSAKRGEMLGPWSAGSDRPVAGAGPEIGDSGAGVARVLVD